MTYTVNLWNPDDATETDELAHFYGRPTHDFAWKHAANPSGKSILAYARSPDGTIVAARALWRWRLVRNGTVYQAAQPCDTETHRDHQRRGLFTSLTEAAVAQAHKEGISFLFNFPNAASKPGNLKLGWTDFGQFSSFVVPPRPIRTVWRLARSGGESKVFRFANRSGVTVTASPGCPPHDGRLWGFRSPEVHAWRVCRNPARDYIAVECEGLTFLFARGHRGKLLEATLVEVTVPSGRWDDARRKLLAAARASESDFVRVLASPGHPILAGLFPPQAWRTSSRVQFVCRSLDGTNLGTADRWALVPYDIDTF